MSLMHDSPAALALHSFTVLPQAPAITLSLPRRGCIAVLGIAPDCQDIETLTARLTGQATIGQAVMPPQVARMLVAGEDVTHRPPGSRHVASCGVHAPLFGHLSVLDNILFPLRAQGTLEPHEILRQGHDLLALTGLDHARHLRADTLSPSQAFRAGLARALIQKPEVLILNQPFADMAPQTSQQEQAMLDRLRHALGLSILLMTRQRSEALLSADSIAVMDRGALLQNADAPTLLSRPACPAVAVAMDDANVLTGKVLDIEDDIASLRLPSGETVEAMADHTLAIDDLACICIPPDRLSVLFPRVGAHAQEETESGDVHCTLVAAHHLGRTIIMRLRSRDGTEITLHRPPVHTMRDLQPGRTGLVAWQARNAIAFPMDEKSR